MLAKLLAAACLGAWIGAAQPAFEVASIKPAAPDQPGTGTNNPPGRYLLHNATLRFAIKNAFRLEDYQLSGGPKWMDSDHYEIEGKTSEAATLPAKLAMMQTLIINRFQLKFHRESREMAGYALVPAKNGLKLTKSESADGVEGTSSGPAMVSGRNQTMAGLAILLSRALSRPVLDETGYKDRFDFRLVWASTSDEPAASVFSLIQEQLGLRLEARRVPIELFVIEGAERPAAN